MTTSKITFPASDGHQLAARLEKPIGPGNGLGAVFAHCFTCSKDIGSAREISRSLAAEGWTVLRFDFTGLGESQGEFADTNFSSNISDLLKAAEFLSENYAPVNLLVGHSLGGAAVLAASGMLKSVKAVATIGAPAEAKHVAHLINEKDRENINTQGSAMVSIGGRPFAVKKQFLTDLEQHSYEERLQKLDAALLIMHSPTDDIVGIDNAAKIYQAAKHPKSFLSLPHADHLLSRKVDQQYVAKIISSWSQSSVVFAPPAKPQTEGTVEVNEMDPNGFLQSISAGKHHYLADEPESFGGTDRGASPYDLLLAGLGACTSMTLRMFAKRKKMPLENVSVKLRHTRNHTKDCSECDGGTMKLEAIERDILIEGDQLTPEDRQALLEIADRCPVHRTMLGKLEIITKAT